MMNTLSKDKAKKLAEVLNESRNGVDEFYHHWFARQFLYSDGIRAAFTAAGAYWLLDLLALKMMAECDVDWSDPPGIGMITITSENNEADVTLTFTYDIEVSPVWSEHIDYTDFPEGTYTFEIGYHSKGPTIALILLSEH